MSFAVALAILTLALAAAVPSEGQVRCKSFAYSPGQSWQNKLARVRLGLGAEVELETGNDPAAPVHVALQPAGAPEIARDESRSVTRLASSDGSLGVVVTYEADPKWPILHKTVEVTNSGTQNVRLLNVVLGRFPAGSAKTEGGARGFPLYLNQQFFVSLTHPAGFAHVEGTDVVLRQYPGVKLAPGQTFRSMEAVYGVAKTGGARKLFVDYVRSRMARVLLHHDKPYAILEAFGGQPEGDFKVNFEIGISDKYLLRHLGQVEKSERENGVQFDFYSIEFWHERSDALKEFSKANFPNGFGPVKDGILRLGMKPGLWIDSSGIPSWTVDRNPDVKGCYTSASGQEHFCRASEPINQIYKDGFSYQIRENKAGLLKFDNLTPVCNNPAHDHVPGPLYSTEAIYNAAIDFLQTIRKAGDVFIMLYWGWRSPWWLQYGDTYFECGDAIEAASPAQFPTPYARDAVTQRLDQAQRQIVDTPWLGKDSLGVWLSDWSWNSGIGKARWQEGVIMDMARGGLLFQLWTDTDWLTPPEREQVATFIKLLKANPACFDNCRPILGDPNKAEPYGYSCCDGKRAFLAIHNACLKDATLKLKPGPAYGLPGNRTWDVYRWYPNPAKLTAEVISLRPYEVVLLEVVPADGKPSLGTSFPNETSTGFVEKTCTLPLSLAVSGPDEGRSGKWKVVKPEHAAAAHATLTTRADGSILASGENVSFDAYTVTVPVSGKLTGIMLEALTDNSLPAKGPGRAVNGNFSLTDLTISLDGKPIAIRGAEADFSQTSFGGWPVTAAIDADPKSGWSIHPDVGQPHAGVFELATPVDAPSGAKLTVTLTNGQKFHNIGRFRLSMTGDPAPMLPAEYRPGRVTLRTVLPATKTGGLVFLVGGAAEDSPQGTLAFTSVWSTDTNWGCPWVAWRAEAGPSDAPRPLEIRLSRRQTKAAATFGAYWLPK